MDLYAHVSLSDLRIFPAMWVMYLMNCASPPSRRQNIDADITSHQTSTERTYAWFCFWFSSSHTKSRCQIGNARIAGMEEDLNLTGNRYSIALLIFFIGYLLGEVRLCESLGVGQSDDADELDCHRYRAT